MTCWLTILSSQELAFAEGGCTVRVRWSRGNAKYTCPHVFSLGQRSCFLLLLAQHQQYNSCLVPWQALIWYFYYWVSLSPTLIVRFEIRYWYRRYNTDETKRPLWLLVFHVPKIDHVNTWSFPVLETNPCFLIKELVEYFCISIFVTFIVYKYGVLISLRQEDKKKNDE